MQTDVKQVFYFHADANSLGGYLEEPFRFVPTPCSVSLSPTGGTARADAENYHFREGAGEEGIRARASLTHVTGRPSRKNGPWTQRVVSVVEGFSLLGRITADRLVAQMFIEQPGASDGPRRISFAGSHIANLRIDGKPVTLNLDATLLPQHHRDVDASDQDTSFTPELEWPALRDYAYRQAAGDLKRANAPGWVQERFGWMDPKAGEASFEGYALCSLVQQIDQTGDQVNKQADEVTAVQSFGHAIEIPGLGRIFLAEAVILPYAAHLTMLRAELGCKVAGQVSAAAVGSNGTTMPPNRTSSNPS